MSRLGDVADVLMASWRRFTDHRMGDGAAALSYYALLSLFPTLLILTTVVRIVGSDAVDGLTEFAGDRGASSALTEGLRGILDTAASTAPSGAGAIGLTGLATLVYGASKAFTAAGRQLDVIAGAPADGRPLGRRAQDIAWTLALLLLMVVLLILVFLTGNLAHDLLDAVGLPELGRLAWDLVRWPAAGALAMVMVATVVWAAPSSHTRAFRPTTTGTLFTVGTWLLASAAYGFYVGHVSDYNATYGAFAAIVILMVWVWMGSMAFLFGAELDAELDARRRR